MGGKVGLYAPGMGRMEINVEKERTEMLWRASVLLQGGSSLLIRSLGRVTPADWPQARLLEDYSPPPVR